MITLTAAAVRILREAVDRGAYGHSSGLFRPMLVRKRGPGKWRRAGGRDAKAIAQLEAAGLVTVTRRTRHEYAFRGTEYVCRPTTAAAAALAALTATEAAP